MSVDIKFIARKAGVSIATVSRVLNRTKPVSDELRERVMREVERYNYRPNTLARGLILNKTNLIGVVAPNVSNIYHAEVLSSIEKCAERYDYNVIVSNVYADFEREKKSFMVFDERRVDGIILLHENTPEELESVAALVSVPIVLSNVQVPGSRLPWVGIDDERAAFDAVSYLLRIGHRRIGGIFADSYALGVLRRNGFLRAYSRAGLAPEPGLVAQTVCNMEDAAREAERMMQRPEPPTAIFCASDEMAIGVMDFLFKHGYDVPGDVSVFGFDNINLARIIRPRLSTVNQPVQEIGTQSMKLLAALMRGQPVVNTHITLEHSLVIRDSCKSIGVPAGAPACANTTAPNATSSHQ